mmetsp:Transcript_19150/g.31755  ORF Transcript_19150/g.31755 Transcript_19150/m.31755 type:complete len:917 (-) Transcript_19150:990-3740(-)|eukprot:CAMPEP_0119031944 /NCGR_PEP_ID=MMETSP1176-20130426/41804_1 /TAXON_ID=265551 /ORGANISM="Synedropsis recta cf, Strain CCMP1620" /LENGTH=916 /DNA_ID=CAMNT_0006988351 /DNA_START=51 /DNA_END=2801 /DNA_ORIENTATION=-
MALAADVSCTDDNIRQQVRICLMKIKKDDAFMESQLHASDYDIINKDNKVKYNLFLHYVSMSLMKSKRKKASIFVNQRLKKSDIVQNEIEQFDPDTYVPEDPPVMGSKSEPPPPKKKKAKKAKAAKIDKMDVDDDDDEEPADDKKDNKKRPRSKSSSTKKVPTKGGGETSNTKRVNIQFSKKERRLYSDDAKNEFISVQDELLERVPEEHSKHWGEIVFGKWKKDPHRPVVLLGPYGVPPGTLRDTWVKMFENTKGDPKRMWYWCFWYGAPLGEAYTQQKFKDFTSFENATKKKLDKLPDKIKDKVNKGKKISKVEEQTIAGFECLEAELAKTPEERCPEAFRELHEDILNLEDEVSLAEDVLEDDDEDMESDPDDDDLAETVKAPPAKKAKTTAKKKKTKDVKPAAKKKTKKQVQPVEDDFINDFGEQELSNEDSSDSDDDEKDDDFDKQEVEDGDDKDDLDFNEEEGNKAKSSKKKKQHSGTKEAVSKPKKEKKKQKAAKPSPESRDPAKEDQLAKRRDRDRKRKRKQDEVKAYEECVSNFKGVVTELRNATEKEDTAKMVKCMTEIKENVKDFSAPFIGDFKLAPLIKSAKAILTSSDDKKVRKELWEELKGVYNEKIPKVPEGWKDLLKSEKGEPKEERAKSEVKKTPKTKRVSQDSEDRTYQNGGDKSEKVKEKQAPSLDRNRHDRDVTPKRKRDEIPGSSTKPRVDSSTSQAPSRKTEFKRDESTGSSAKQRVDSSAQLSAIKAPKRKTSLTSLKSLLNKDVKTPKSKSENTPSARKSLEPVLVVKKLPEWLTTDLAMDPAIESNETRCLGLDFFLELSESFPSIVNQASLARALESATYAWAKEQEAESWEEAYWGKVHMAVGSIAGKHRAGSLMAAIVDGKHLSAKGIIGLSDDELLISFEGGQNGCY